MRVIRAGITVSGKVQKVGYRDFVQEIARKLGIRGFVENLKDGSVGITCEGDEGPIAEFLERIKTKEEFIEVEDARVLEKTRATGEFESFDIKYGKMEEEFGERAGALMLYMKGMKGGVGEVRQSVDSMHKQVRKSIDSMHQGVRDVKQSVDSVNQGVVEVRNSMDSTRKQVEQSVESMHKDMNTRFDETAIKYGEISASLEDIKNDFRRLVDHVTQKK